MQDVLLIANIAILQRASIVSLRRPHLTLIYSRAPAVQLPFQYIPPAVAPKHTAGTYVLDDTILSVSSTMIVMNGDDGWETSRKARNQHLYVY